jgi:tRNA (cmo5U34)-methyltransferase
MSGKSSVAQIRARFDQDVERFSKLETGQSATMDAPLALELVAQASARVSPQARHLLDLGCGAGNYSLKLLEALPGLDVTLIDLSRPMLDRALERVGAATRGEVRAWQGDVREIDLGKERFDVIVAAAVFHHLREEREWREVFGKCHAALRVGGCFWISDFIEHSIPEVQALMWERYGAYLVDLKGEAYRDQVFAYVGEEDTPRSVLFQCELLRASGFTAVDILHKNSCFAVFGGKK